MILSIISSQNFSSSFISTCRPIFLLFLACSFSFIHQPSWRKVVIKSCRSGSGLEIWSCRSPKCCFHLSSLLGSVCGATGPGDQSSKALVKDGVCLKGRMSQMLLPIVEACGSGSCLAHG